MAPLNLKRKEPSHFSNFPSLYWVISSGDVPLDDQEKQNKEKKLTVALENLISIWAATEALEKYICNLMKTLYEKWACKSCSNSLLGESELLSYSLRTIQ